MQYAPKIVLHIKSPAVADLKGMVEKFLQGGVKFIGVLGPGADLVKDAIDWGFIGSDGTVDPRHLLTAAHEGETLDAAVEFARQLALEYEGEVQVVEA